ncbi:MAG: hypothetical protein C0391_01670 [Anaerolinea sp.]|nr:hypothetical protein [Anaerolinea sp.]
MMNMDRQNKAPQVVKHRIPSRMRFGLGVSVFGLLVFLLGARPSLFGLDRSPVIGFIQIVTFLVGLAIICIGGYISLVSLWGKEQRSIKADFGVRLVSTGFVLAAFSALADVFGFGSHPLPGPPYFGPWQAGGVEIGQLLIAIGFILLIPFHHQKFISR